MIFQLQCSVCKRMTANYHVKKVHFMYYDVWANMCPECDKLSNSELEKKWQVSFRDSTLYTWVSIIAIGWFIGVMLTAGCINQMVK